MEIRFAPAGLPEGGTLAVTVHGDATLGPTAQDLDGRLDGALTRALRASGDKLKRGRFVELLAPAGVALERVLLMGLGDVDKLKPLDVEELGAGLTNKLRALRLREAAVAVDPLPAESLPPAAFAAHLALGARLRNYRFAKYRTGDDEDEAPRPTALTLLLTEPEAGQAAYADFAAVAAGVAHARDLVSEPANVLHPKAFAEACRGLSDLGLAVEILDKAELERLGMNALLAVGRGSAHDPYVAVMRWQGGGDGEAPVALIGKGVCFDSGGLSLKPAAGMEGMKWDMGGAGAVFGAMKALAGRRAKANVVGVLGLVENMPSGTAQRPGDVVKAMSGTTIEVINTDAEGRLLLADVLWYTQDRFKPKAMVDLATLTGAIIVALGHEHAGLFSPDDDLAAAIAAAGAAVGETVWRMPLGKDYAKHIKSSIADIKNVGRSRQAGATAGAVFLQRFVGEVPWAHIDIAGTAWTERDLPLAGKGATGFGVRLLDRLIADRYERP